MRNFDRRWHLCLYRRSCGCVREHFSQPLVSLSLSFVGGHPSVFSLFVIDPCIWLTHKVVRFVRTNGNLGRSPVGVKVEFPRCNNVILDQFGVLTRSSVVLFGLFFFSFQSHGLENWIFRIIIVRITGHCLSEFHFHSAEIALLFPTVGFLVLVPARFRRLETLFHFVRSENVEL